MPLSVVSRETYEVIKREWRNDHAAFCLRVGVRLEEGNPVLAKFLDDFFTTYRGHKNPLVVVHGLVLAFSIYEALDHEGEVPVVSEEIGAPMRAEFERNPRRYVMSVTRSVISDQPILLSFFADLIVDFFVGGDQEGGQIVVFAGVSMYQMIKNQVESDELSASLPD